MKNRTFYTLMILAIICPLMSFLISSTFVKSGEIEGLGKGLLAIISVPLIGIVGLIVSAIISLSKVKNRKWSLLGYVIPGLLLSLVIIL